MKKMKRVLLTALVLISVLIQSYLVQAASGYVNLKYATRDSKVVESDAYKSFMTIRTSVGSRRFYSYDQSDMRQEWMSKKEALLFLKTGCSACAVTTILNAYSPV